MNTELIRMFNKVVASTKISGNQLSYKDVNKIAMPLGYIVHPNACYSDVMRFLKEQKMNPNSTFYKTFDDVLKKDRYELLLDQTVHYFSTYGTNFALGNGYVPNEEADYIPYTTYKYILPASEEEFVDNISSMLNSGIAMSSNTINIFVDFLERYNLLNKINVDEIKNKEAQCIFSVKKGVFPSDEFGMLRTLVYFTTGSAMIIKSKDVIKNIKYVVNYNEEFARLFNTFTDKELVKLSRIFYRYKPIFLAMKTKDTASKINKIRRYAETNHTPLVKGFWETILNPEDKSYALKKASEEVNTITNFKKVQIMQAIKGRIASSATNGRAFVIRNGKMFVREGYKAPVDSGYLFSLYGIFEKSLIDFLKEKATTYKIQPGINLAVPTSEKNFIGNYPMGSYVKMSGEDNVIGIYWKNEWGVNDYDLHYINDKNEHYGWNADYHNGSTVCYSGDMTNADPEASETYLLKGKEHCGKIDVNIFYRSLANVKPKLRFFIATSNDEYDKKLRHMGGMRRTTYDTANAMVNPDQIKFDTFIEFDDNCECSQKSLGYVYDGKFYFINAGTGYKLVPTMSRNEIIQQQFKITCQSFVNLNELLEKAGFTKSEEEAELDLSVPTKEQLIKLFS